MSSDVLSRMDRIDFMLQVPGWLTPRLKTDDWIRFQTFLSSKEEGSPMLMSVNTWNQAMTPIDPSSSSSSSSSMIRPVSRVFLPKGSSFATTIVQEVFLWKCCPTREQQILLEEWQTIDIQRGEDEDDSGKRNNYVYILVTFPPPTNTSIPDSAEWNHALCQKLKLHFLWQYSVHWMECPTHMHDSQWNTSKNVLERWMEQCKQQHDQRKNKEWKEEEEEEEESSIGNLTQVIENGAWTSWVHGMWDAMAKEDDSENKTRQKQEPCAFLLWAFSQVERCLKLRESKPKNSSTTSFVGQKRVDCSFERNQSLVPTSSLSVSPQVKFWMSAMPDYLDDQECLPYWSEHERLRSPWTGQWKALEKAEETRKPNYQVTVFLKLWMTLRRRIEHPWGEGMEKGTTVLDEWKTIWEDCFFRPVRDALRLEWQSTLWFPRWLKPEIQRREQYQYRVHRLETSIDQIEQQKKRIRTDSSKVPKESILWKSQDVTRQSQLDIALEWHLLDYLTWMESPDERTSAQFLQGGMVVSYLSDPPGRCFQEAWFRNEETVCDKEIVCLQNNQHQMKEDEQSRKKRIMENRAREAIRVWNQWCEKKDQVPTQSQSLLELGLVELMPTHRMDKSRYATFVERLGFHWERLIGKKQEKKGVSEERAKQTLLYRKKDATPGSKKERDLQ